MNVRDFAILNITVAGVPITTIRATENSDALDVGNYVEAIVFLPVTAHSGTNPTLDCKIQYSPNYDPMYPTLATWCDSGDAFTQVTTTNSVTFKKLSAIFGRWIRLAFTIGGTATPLYTVVPVISVKS